LSQAPHWATESCLVLSASSSSTASDHLCFCWDSSKGKSTGSHRHLDYKRYYDLVCIVMRSNLVWSPAPHWATISCLVLSTSSSSAASDQLCFGWDSSKGKSTGSHRHLAYKRYYDLVSMCTEEVQFGLVTSTSLGHHIVSSAVRIRLIRC
jgi:hypothetical protein